MPLLLYCQSAFLHRVFSEKIFINIDMGFCVVYNYKQQGKEFYGKKGRLGTIVNTEYSGKNGRTNQACHGYREICPRKLFPRRQRSAGLLCERWKGESLPLLSTAMPPSFMCLMTWMKKYFSLQTRQKKVRRKPQTTEIVF